MNANLREFRARTASEGTRSVPATCSPESSQMVRTSVMFRSSKSYDEHDALHQRRFVRAGERPLPHSARLGVNQRANVFEQFGNIVNFVEDNWRGPAPQEKHVGRVPGMSLPAKVRFIGDKGGDGTRRADRYDEAILLANAACEDHMSTYFVQ